MDKDNPPTNEVSCTTCPGKVEVPTEEEREALAAMRSIKERVRQLKGYLAEQKALGRDKDRRNIGEIREELLGLKKDWDRWEKKRKQAAKERMILLGHEEGSW